MATGTASEQTGSTHVVSGQRGAASRNLVGYPLYTRRFMIMLDYFRIALAARMRSERGASAVEYGLLIAGIAALVVVIVFAFGDNIRDIFEDTCKSVSGSTSCRKD